MHSASTSNIKSQQATKSPTKLLQAAISHASQGDIDSFSKIEHILSQNIHLKQTDEENDFFDKFYLIQALSRVCLHSAGELESEIITTKKQSKIYAEFQWGIICKGPFTLAHNDFLEEFLHGLPSINKLPSPQLICIDSPPPNTHPFKGLGHLPLYKLQGTHSKIRAYKNFAKNLDLAIWFACTQNLSLYMGNRFCKKEAIWSMKHLKMRPGSVDFLLTGGSKIGQRLDGPTSWHHGRCMAHSMRKILYQNIQKSKKIKENEHFIFSTVVRGEKLRSKEFWKCTFDILKNHKKAKLKIATSIGAEEIKLLLKDYDSSLENHMDQLLIFPWQKSPEVFISTSDCYLDTFPMGSGLMGQYAVLMGITYIGLNCSQTLKSSFAANLADFCEEKNCINFELLGLADTPNRYVEIATKEINLWYLNRISAINKNQHLYREEIRHIADNFLMSLDYSEIISKQVLT